MKAITIDSSLELKQVEYDSFDIVYRRCGYRSINNFVALANEQFTDESTVLEFWGKRSKKGYDYRGHTLYGICVIILKKGGEIIDLTIDGYNEITLFGANGDKQDIHEVDTQHLKEASESYQYVAKKYDWPILKNSK